MASILTRLPRLSSLPLAKLSNLANNTYVTASASLFLMLYAGMARPQLPEFVAKLFNDAIFRVFILSLVVFMGGQNIQVSILIAIAFTVTMNLLNEQKIAEGFVSKRRGQNN